MTAPSSPRSRRIGTIADPPEKTPVAAIGVLAGVAEALPSLVEALASADVAWRTVSEAGDDADEITTLLIGGGSFGAVAMDRFPHLDLLVRAGIGLDLIDLPEATQRGITVVNTPGYGTREVADHALLLMLTITRRLHHFEQQAGSAWHGVICSGVPRLADATLGIIGLGAIGRALSHRAQALDMTVIAHDPYVDPADFTRHGVTPCSRETLLATSDVISLHAPLTGETHHLLNEQSFSRMERRPVIINTARGGLINNDHLLDALGTGRVSAAGLDVIEGEPSPPTDLLECENVIVTPHVGWYSEGSRDEMGRLAATAAITGCGP